MRKRRKRISASDNAEQRGLRRTDADAMKQAAANIRDELGRSNKVNVQTAMWAGEELFQVHERISNHGNGRFYAWIKKEFTRTYELSIKTAERWMRLHTFFGKKDSATLSQFTLSALYLLCEPGYEQAIDLAFTEAAKKKRITRKFIERLANDLWEMKRDKKYPDKNDPDLAEEPEPTRADDDDAEPQSVLLTLKKQWTKASFEERQKFQKWIKNRMETKPPEDA